MEAAQRVVYPACINSYNPYHECSEYCLQKIQQKSSSSSSDAPAADGGDVSVEGTEERAVHPECINAGNPFHACTDFCFKRIALARSADELPRGKEQLNRDLGGDSQQGVSVTGRQRNNLDGQQDCYEVGADQHGTDDRHKESVDASAYPEMTEKQRKLFELRLKMNEARKANQIAMIAEKKKQEAPTESRGVSKEKWLEDRKKKIGKLLDSNGLELSKSYMLDTQEVAEQKYKKWEKEPAPSGWEVFNQRTLYNAYKKRTKTINVDMEAYNRAKEADPEFYRDASSLQYGKASKVPEENIDKMVEELHDREAKRKAFSRRRRYHEEKDIDSINDRNEHFNKKIERAFGKYTVEIKNNLERGTALPD